MSEPRITIDLNEAQEIERNIIMQKTFYRPTENDSRRKLDQKQYILFGLTIINL